MTCCTSCKLALVQLDLLPIVSIITSTSVRHGGPGSAFELTSASEPQQRAELFIMRDLVSQIPQRRTEAMTCVELLDCAVVCTLFCKTLDDIWMSKHQNKRSNTVMTFSNEAN